MYIFTYMICVENKKTNFLLWLLPFTNYRSSWRFFVKHYFVPINSYRANRKRRCCFLSNLTCASRLCGKHARRSSRGSSRVSPAKHNTRASRVELRGLARTINSTWSMKTSSSSRKSWATRWPLIGWVWAARQSRPGCREAVAPSNSREGFE